MIPVEEAMSVGYQNYYHDLTFRVIGQEDPENQRTNLRKAPDMLTESK